MQNYINARELLKKELFDKLMIDRFGWEINIEGEIFVIDSALTIDEHELKIRIVEKIIRYLIFEFDKYIFICENQMAEDGKITYQNIPTLLSLIEMSVEWEDSNMSEEYEVDPKTFERINKETDVDNKDN